MFDSCSLLVIYDLHIETTTETKKKRHELSAISIREPSSFPFILLFSRHRQQAHGFFFLLGRLVFGLKNMTHWCGKRRECGCSWHHQFPRDFPNQNKLFSDGPSFFFFLFSLSPASLYTNCVIHIHTHIHKVVVDSNLRNWIESAWFEEKFCLRFSIKCNVSVHFGGDERPSGVFWVQLGAKRVLGPMFLGVRRTGGEWNNCMWVDVIFNWFQVTFHDFDNIAGLLTNFHFWMLM